MKCVRCDRTTARQKLNGGSAKIIESSDVIFAYSFFFYGKMIKAKGIQYFKRMSCANGIFNLIRGQQIEDTSSLAHSLALPSVLHRSFFWFGVSLSLVCLKFIHSS